VLRFSKAEEKIMSHVEYNQIEIDGTVLAYREAGPKDGPTVLLLHGFPSSSHMFRDLIPKLSDRFHLIAPDYPGFGYSAAPSPATFEYTFDNLSHLVEKLLDKLAMNKVSLYVHDYGGPIGFRLANRRPELIRAIVVQNAVAHLEGISEAFKPLRDYWEERSPQNEAAVRQLLAKETTLFQYTHGASHPERISPDSYTLDQALLDRPGNDLIQLELFYDYKNNPPKYDQWQSYLRKHKPPMLVIWGENDPFFTTAGANAFARDNSNAKVKMLNAGHFALEEASQEIADEMRALADRVKSGVYAEAEAAKSR
jgi:pimeloyl-ACP methyl ester carboxylesterase